jgi:hypothetical protein
MQLFAKSLPLPAPLTTLQSHRIASHSGCVVYIHADQKKKQKEKRPLVLTNRCRVPTTELPLDNRCFIVLAI